MIEIQTWLFLLIIAGLIAASVIMGIQDDRIKKLKAKLKDKKNLT